MKKSVLFICLLLISTSNFAQDWTLKLSSNVELRTWKLTTKADKDERPLGGASIVLTKGGAVVSQSNSDGNGDFTVLVPPNGEFILTVSYSGCNAKKFLINTQGVPDAVGKDNYKPTFSIGGFVMAKPFPGIDYSGLQKTLVKVEYKPRGKNFDHDDVVTDEGLNIVSKIANAENILIEKFCSTNRAGDVALAKPDCPLAKSLYEQAIATIPGEQYPVIQLAKVGLCLKEKEEASKKAAEEAAAKANAEKANAEKALAEKAAKEKAEAEKQVAEKAEADKIAKEKSEKEKTEKAEAEKIAKQKSDAEKEVANATTKAAQAAAEKAAEEKALADKVNKEKNAVEKAEADKLAKEKTEKEKAEKTEADKLAREKASKEKNERAEADKLAKQKEASEKEARRRAAASQSDDGRMPKTGSESETKKFSYETKASDGEGEMDKGNSKRKIPQVLGVNKYKEVIARADDYYKTKRYLQAKTEYEEALRLKANDVHAINRIEQCTKFLAPK